MDLMKTGLNRCNITTVVKVTETRLNVDTFPDGPFGDVTVEVTMTPLPGTTVTSLPVGAKAP